MHDVMIDGDETPIDNVLNNHKRLGKLKSGHFCAAGVGGALALLVFGASAGVLAEPIDRRCFDETGTMQLYDPICCCTSGWCGPIDDRFVVEVPGGWQLTIPPGGHVRLKPGTYYVPEGRARPSRDGRWHVCGQSEVSCFFRVPGAV